MTIVYPKGLDAFMPAVDGWTPISANDLNDLALGSLAVQRGLGYGPSVEYADAGFKGPKGANINLKERLDSFLTPDGQLLDVVLVTGESAAHEFDEAGIGVLVQFGKTISGVELTSANAYCVWFQAFGDNEENDQFDFRMPAIFWVAERFGDACTIQGRGMNGGQLKPVLSFTVKWACLVVGGQVPGTYIRT